MFEILKTGKDLKKAFAHIKPIQNPINPMGSNFDSITPDLGVILEEKGRSKKGAGNFAATNGKLSL